MKWIVFILGAITGSAVTAATVLTFFVIIPKMDMVGYTANIDGITYQWRPIRGPRIRSWDTPDSATRAKHNIPYFLCMKQFFNIDTGGRQEYIKPRGIEVIIKPEKPRRKK